MEIGQQPVNNLKFETGVDKKAGAASSGWQLAVRPGTL